MGTALKPEKTGVDCRKKEGNGTARRDFEEGEL